MSVKIKQKSIYFALLMLSTTALFGGNYLVSSLYKPDFMVALTIIVCSIILLANGLYVGNSRYKVTIVLCIIVWITGIFSAMSFGVSFFRVFTESLETIIPIVIYYSFRKLLKNKEDLNLFLKAIFISSVLCNVISFVELFFALNGIDLLHINVFSKMRNGIPRFSIGETVLIIGFFLSISIVLDGNVSKREKIKHYVNIILTVLNVVLVIKTRSRMIYLATTILIIPIINKRYDKKIRLLFLVILIGLLSILILGNYVPVINMLIDSDYGVQVRRLAIEHYWRYIKEKWLFGVGFIPDRYNSVANYIMCGPKGKYYTSDVGIVGLIFRNGLLGLAWYISWFFAGVKNIRSTKKMTPNYYYSFMVLLITFLLISSINLIMTDSSRFPYIAFGMLIIESSNLFSISMEDNEGKQKKFNII